MLKCVCRAGRDEDTAYFVMPKIRNYWYQFANADPFQNFFRIFPARPAAG